MPSRSSTLWAAAEAPVDPASLAFFRAALGVTLFLASLRCWSALEGGWLPQLFDAEAFRFSYAGFSWVKPWPLWGLYLHCALFAAASLAFAAGLFYRASAAAVFGSLCYLFLLERAAYVNHLYLLCLASGLMLLAPAQRAFSLDAARDRALAARRVPGWPLALLRAQLVLVYLFSGLAKLQGDWLRGYPLRLSLDESVARAVLPAAVDARTWALVLGWGGLSLELAVVPLLLWKRARPAAFAGLAVFHLLTAWLFRIGAFPWLMLGAATLFFEPDWPRRLLRLGPGPEGPRPKPAGRAARGFAAAYLAVQILLPLRHHLYPGRDCWSGEGHEFAWHMFMIHKRSEAAFVVRDPERGESLRVEPRARLGEFRYRAMAGSPELLRQFAHRLAREVSREKGWRRVEVRAETAVAFNGRAAQPIVDPSVDLAAEPWRLGHAPWILPLTQPLPAE